MILGKKEERRQEILDHALKLFVEKGYHQTRTSEITNSVGIGKGTLFNYFNTKEDLINELYTQVKEEVYSILISEKAPEEHIYNFIKRNWMNFISWGINNYNKIRFIMQMEDSPLISEEMKSKIELQDAKYAALYQEGITQGFLKDIPLILGLTLYYQAMLTTIHYIVNSEPTATEVEQLEISMKAFNNYLYGVRK
ncbi:MAG: putative TetR family transcriptional regulator Member [Promethearchaeota archaeon]|nr:MAG: putative TetR family transcriptional regulator Member [Candidatus Lokiarchaeota archaeon]